MKLIERLFPNKLIRHKTIRSKSERWSQYEVHLLKAAIKNYGKYGVNWAEVAAKLERSVLSCKRKYQRLQT